MNENKTREPLLYIEQPNLTIEQPFMQQNYSSLTKPKKKSKEEPQRIERPKRIKRERSNPFFDLLTEEDINLDDNDEVSQNLEQKKEVEADLAFNDLTVQGKIDYFVNLPTEMPPMKCKVKLQNDAYNGYILKDDGDSVSIRSGRANYKVKKEEINDIDLLGF